MIKEKTLPRNTAFSVTWMMELAKTESRCDEHPKELTKSM